MKFTLFSPLWLLLFVVVANAQTSVFNYQGQLSDNGAPANGQYDLRFTLHDTPTQPNQIGNTVTNSPVSVTNGLFTVALDFGSAVFDGGPRWLEIGVRPFGNSGAYTVLLPRQPLTSVPYAIRALTAGSASNLLGTLPDARLSTNVALLTGTANFQANVSGSNFFGNGNGLTNVPGFIFKIIPTAVNMQGTANFGYLATNDSTAVVVTLPTDIEVGETIRVSASGAGGWVVAQNAGQSILFAGLADRVGVTWTPRENSRNWKALASSADGSRLAAVVNGGQAYVSTNYGVNWTARDANRGWSCVASSADGMKLVAAVTGGFIYTSTDGGTNWTSRLAVANWSGVASSLDGVNLVAVISGAGQIYTSTNSGINWTLRLGAFNWSSVASSGNGTRLVATVQGGLIYTSTNSGLSWGPQTNANNRAWVSVASSLDGSRLLAAVNNGDLYMSTDFGTNWMAVGTGSPQAWTSVASSADGSKLAAIVNLGNLFVSTDSGTTWQQRNGLPTLGWNATTISGDGGTLAAAGGPTQIYVSSQATTTSGTAGSLTGARLSAVELVYVGNGEFMPVSYVGTIRAR